MAPEADETFGVTLSNPTRVSSRDRLIAAAADLFHERGIRATGVDRVVEVAGRWVPLYFVTLAGSVRAEAALSLFIVFEGG